MMMTWAPGSRELAQEIHISVILDIGRWASCDLRANSSPGKWQWPIVRAVKESLSARKNTCMNDEKRRGRYASILS